MATLAIKGHYTRGEEVIKILEILGGINLRKLEGIDPNYYYTIENDGTILGRINTNLCNKHVSYTIEEFLEKYPYKVGDKVLINGNTSDVHIVKSMKWDNERVTYRIENSDGLESITSWYANEMMPYAEQIEETMEERQYKELRMPLDDDGKLATEVTIDGDKILPPNDYLIGKITQLDNGMLVEYVKKQSQYPKTYKECCGVLKIPKNEHYIDIDAPLVPSDYNRLVSAFTKLLICRDAYWLIAGKQMGLDKPWKPDDSKNHVYYIFYCVSNDEIRLAAGNLYFNEVFAFPTEEMRDAFFENFKDVIEQCKELL